MITHPLIKADANGQLSLLSLFIPPLRLKVSSKIEFLRHTLHPESGGRRHWGRSEGGLFRSRLSH